MLIVAFLIISITALLALCFIIKKNVFRIICGVAAGILAAITIILGLIIFELDYHVRTVDVNTADNGEYSVELKSVGSPLFFGAANGRLVLKEGDRIIISRDFTLFDDGGSVRESSWSVKWQEDKVEIVISGDEQYDCLYILGFDSKYESKQLESKFGKSDKADSSTTLEDYEEKGEISSLNNFDNSASELLMEEEKLEEQDSDGVSENQTGGDDFSEIEDISHVDNNAYPVSEEYDLYKNQMKAILKYIIKNGIGGEKIHTDKGEYSVSCYLNAKGNPYSVIYTGSDVLDGIFITVEQRLILTESGGNMSDNEYVLEESYFDSQGNEAEATKILDFYMVDAKMNVTDENTTQWH